ncbi:dihydrofolate reductase [Demequina lignilytica]|uniref:Dihydrofolate reductase n=1 Tax=Demequina lignilytica TaxID=3051663 RepID=A0AAW7M8F9_9MICO|nr:MULTISPECIES: dihydrofolate reductase [unclassified Demequina]MDN4477158.1 dihydrofolate reductase [Demequina sp. SYSU T00039-1]MDN4484006.1 dihydrofolate reductase [Demequina sp. SYSU T0a273]MDN4487331.1 dihydrofolate reductase [Demequina sp. SYSU T00039]MDN4491084.1 dihydrofolate reductase [Demequina sp. SYSU T00068]
MVKAIWAQARDGEGRPVIGLGGTMPWHLPEDLAHFSETTHGEVVIMGRLTWESLPERFRPLPSRTNIVVSHHENTFHGAASASSLEGALDAAEDLDPDATCWVMGGARLFAEAAGIADEIVVTEIDLVTEGDTFAPTLDPDAWRVKAADWQESRTGLRYRIVRHRRR